MKRMFLIIIVAILMVSVAYYINLSRPIHLDPITAVQNPNNINQSTIYFTMKNNTKVPIATVTLASIGCKDYGIEAQCEATINLSLNQYNINLLNSLGYTLPPINSTPFFNYTGTKPNTLGILQAVKKTVNATIQVPVKTAEKLNSSYVNKTLELKGYLLGSGNTIDRISILNDTNTSLTSLISSLESELLTLETKLFTNSSVRNEINLINSIITSYTSGNLSSSSLFDLGYIETGNDTFMRYNLSQTNLTLSSFGILSNSTGYFENVTNYINKFVNETVTEYENYNWSMDPPPIIIKANYYDLLGHGFKTVWEPTLFGIKVPLDPTFSAPSGINYYSTLTISNSQSTATPSPFQQMINVSNSIYNGYAASNFQNVEFFYANGTIIPSWLESYSSTNAI
ncbi:MAG: hypothetical protein ACP5MB_07550, partial [bacterium]